MRTSHRQQTDPLLVLIAAGTRAAGDDERQVELDLIVAELADRDPAPDADGSALLALTTQLASLWEKGWQPADVVHLARRRLSQRAARLTGAAVRVEAESSTALQRAPLAWVRQLEELQPVASIAAWAVGEGLDAPTAWRDVLRLLAGLLGLPRMEHLLPPPSAWPGRRETTENQGTPDDRVLGRVRALLAKAESTDFPEEADALTAKAQELMSRHQIDAAMINARGPGLADGVRARRLHLSDPYAEPKAHLAQAAAAANGARVVLLADLGVATVIGLPDDLDLVELLYTSLLLQSTRALAEATRVGTRQTRSAAYRRGFLYSYAARVGERLAAAQEAAAEEASATYGSELVPVLARKAEAVGRATEELFPRLVSRRGRRVDAAGWHAGRAAAERAELGTSREVSG